MHDIINFQGKTLDLGFTSIAQSKEYLTATPITEEDYKKTFTSRKIDFVYNLEQQQKNDKTHSRTAGLTQVWCKLAKEHDIAVAFNYRSLLLAKDPARLLGRMQQNVKLCRKYHVIMIIASFANNPYEQRAPAELESFGILLGMTSKEAHQALNFTKKKKLIY
ncbi:MAG: RNase P subunit p30 family protein [Nanoarchaeota archaeon]|nr:RNase P subunit p30 family protein [Nanoarchaeota archaeon]